MSAADKCSLPNIHNLMQSIHMELSQKLKNFSGVFKVFSKSRLNFEYFQKQDDAHSLFISEATACQKRGSIYVQKVPLQITLPKGKWQTSLNSV